tara:strand:- start:784 stop:1455 length:672 start_codon:yes stop_codon:yes gene_type:complete
MFKAILFDVYGTLLDVHSIQIVLEKYFPGKGMEASKLLRDKQIEYSRLYALRPSEIPYENFMSLTQSAVEYTIMTFGKNNKNILIADIMSSYQRLNAFPEVTVILDYIKSKNYNMAVLSNGDSEMLKEVLGNSGLQDKFDTSLSAGSLKSFKIESKVYKLASDFFECKLGECMLVSANYWDIIGAGWNGMKTFWVNRTGLPKDPLGYEPTFEGKSLKELKQVL